MIKKFPLKKYKIYLIVQVQSNQWCIRDHTDTETYGLFLNNRSGMLEGDEEIESNSRNKCYYPFYKMMVDWNVMSFSALMIGEEKIIGNLLHHSVEDIWMSDEMKSIRKKLIVETDR